MHTRHHHEIPHQPRRRVRTLRGCMLALALAAPLALPAGADAAAYNGDVVREWNGLAFNAIRSTSGTDGAAARLYAMVDAAMYDAVNGTAGGGPARAAAFVAPSKRVDGDPMVAAAQAAHDVLMDGYPALDYPALADSLDMALGQDIEAADSNGEKLAAAKAWGAHVADAVLAARRDDGSSPSMTIPAPPSPVPAGMFGGSMGNAQFASLDPFAIADPSAYYAGPPPALDSHAYADAFHEVERVGQAGTSDPPAALTTFTFWKLSAGSDQPPGAWLQIAQDVSATRKLTLADTARLFALEAMAMADTVAPTYWTKEHYYRWRPYEAINRADEDGNPETDKPASSWVARGGTSGSPEYFSGHSAFAAAGAGVLAGFFCDDAVAFSLKTDGQSETRSYDSFSTAAFETGYSRVLGGQHFPTSNVAGLVAGAGVAREVLANALLRVRDATHGHASCPK